MKRKTFYALMLICFAGLISSANQSKKECTQNALCYSRQAACCAKANEVNQQDSPSLPLNLFLFDL